jgi:hypothetical protein
MVLKAAILGFVVTIITYAVSAACFYAQLHFAVFLLLWSTFFVGVFVLPEPGPVTTGSPENIWVPILGFLLAWLTYSVLSFLWLKSRKNNLST